MRRTRTLALAGAALVGALALSACSGPGASEDAPEKTIDTLAVVMPAARGLDVTTAFDVQTHTLTALGVESLMTFDDTGAIVPNLAESVEVPDAQTYIYTIRDGITFWDGSEMTAEDVAFSLSRNMLPESQLAARYSSVESIEVEDDNKVVIKLKTPLATFAYIPAMYGQIISKAYAEEVGDQLGTAEGLTMGTGPFQPVSFTPDTGAEFVAYEDYWGGEPAVKAVSVQFSSDAAAAALAMRSGEVDFALNVDTKSYSGISDVEFLTASAGDQTVMSFNVNQAPFNDVHVRRAIVHATDVEGIAAAAVGEYGAPSETIVPRSSWAALVSESELDDIIADLPQNTYDMKKAAEELAASAHPDGFEFSAKVIDSDPAMRIAAEALASNLAEIGVTMNIEMAAVSAWLEELYGPRENIGMMFLSFGGGIPDPDKFLYDWLFSGNAVQDGLNTADFKDAEVDEWLATERASIDNDERIGIFSDILTTVAEQLPYAPLYTANKTAVLAGDFEWNGTFSGFYYMKPWANQVTLR